MWTDHGVVQRQESHMLETHHDQQEAAFFASCIELLVKLNFVASSQYKSRANPVQQNLPEIGCHYQVHLTNGAWPKPNTFAKNQFLSAAAFQPNQVLDHCYIFNNCFVLQYIGKTGMYLRLTGLLIE